MLAIVTHWIHTVAALVWIGGVAFIILTLLPTLKKTVAMPVRQQIMGAMVPRFRAIVGVCLALLLLTGLINMWGKVEFGHLLEVPYGRVLCAKLVLVSILFALYLAAPAINRKFQNRECGHGAGQAAGGTCAHDQPEPSAAKKRPEIGVILHGIVLVLGVIVVLLGKVLTTP